MNQSFRAIIEGLGEAWVLCLIGLLAVLAGDGATDTRSLFARAPAAPKDDPTESDRERNAA